MSKTLICKWRKLNFRSHLRTWTPVCCPKLSAFSQW